MGFFCAGGDGDGDGLSGERKNERTLDEIGVFYVIFLGGGVQVHTFLAPGTPSHPPPPQYPLPPEIPHHHHQHRPEALGTAKNPHRLIRSAGATPNPTPGCHHPRLAHPNLDFLHIFIHPCVLLHSDSARVELLWIFGGGRGGGGKRGSS